MKAYTVECFTPSGAHIWSGTWGGDCPCAAVAAATLPPDARPRFTAHCHAEGACSAAHTSMDRQGFQVRSELIKESEEEA